MDDLLYQLFFRFPIIPIAEMVATIYMSRRQVRRRFFLTIGSYLIFVAAAIVFAVVGRNSDEFGFRFIPGFLITWPWCSLLLKLPGHIAEDLYGIILLGASLNCAVFYLIDRLSYPKYSAKTQSRHAT